MLTFKFFQVLTPILSYDLDYHSACIHSFISNESWSFKSKEVNEEMSFTSG
jgi:putative flippase GtrA